MKYFFILSALLFFSCSDGERYLGRVPVKNMDGIYFELYQEQKFDWVLAVDYKIVNEKKEILSGPFFLLGTDYLEDTRDFFASSCGDLVYITFPDTNTVYLIYDVKTKKPARNLSNLDKADTLYEKELKICKPYLRFSWYE